MKKVLVIFVLLFTLMVAFILYAYNIIPHRIFYAEDFDISVLRSENDENDNGVDDYQDILEGAKAEIEDMPNYRSAYYEGGYPPEDEGVCTDVIWRALRNAGYDFKALIDEDIRENIDMYPRVGGTPDPNIDFRRVPNVDMYLKRNTLSQSLDLAEIAQWQPGDIVVFADSHIGIISDKRNSKGIPYLLHNGNQPVGEEDCLEREEFLKGISGHYRFQLKSE